MFPVLICWAYDYSVWIKFCLNKLEAHLSDVEMVYSISPWQWCLEVEHQDEILTAYEPVPKSGKKMTQWKSDNRTCRLAMLKYCVWRLYFHLQKWFYAVLEEYTIKIANQSDLVNRHTIQRVCNSSLLENCYWPLLKLFAVSVTVLVQSVTV